MDERLFLLFDMFGIVDHFRQSVGAPEVAVFNLVDSRVLHLEAVQGCFIVALRHSELILILAHILQLLLSRLPWLVFAPWLLIYQARDLGRLALDTRRCPSACERWLTIKFAMDTAVTDAPFRFCG